MALDNPKNAESIALYKTFIEYKKLVETSSAEVISLVYLNLYDENGAPKELTIAEKYQLLAAAYRLTPFVEESISIVIKDAEENETVVTAAEALLEYEKLLAEYNALVGPVNGEILGMLDTVCALRFNCASAALLELFVSNANSK